MIRPSARRRLRIVAIALLAIAVTGCSVALLPDKQAQRIFTLPFGFEPATEASQSSDKLPMLKVVRPQASGVLGGKRLLIESRPSELAAYSTVRWVTDTPVLLRDHLVRALRRIPGMSGVVTDASGSASEVTLTSNLLAFQEIRTQQTPGVRIYLQAQLVENGSRKILATRDFDIRVPLVDKQVRGVVAALGEASDQLATEMADWIGTALADY
jgi:cholesterol transport system auxiliary component